MHALLDEQWREHEIVLSKERGAAAIATFLADASLGLALLARNVGAAGNDPVGLAVLAYTFTLERGGLVGWLDELYVVPTHRGAGVGTKLLDAALVHAQTAGCVAVELEVVFGHERAANLYARAGFQKLPRARWSRDLFVGEGEVQK
ncbi:MAG: GNAT family N-acetyltransferase [Polyangiaceae bacterium]